MPCEEVTVTTADGLDLAGWYLPSENGAALLLQHGYGGDRQDVMWEASLFHQNGYGVLMTTFRGHDRNASDTFTWSKKESQDLNAFYQYLLTRDDVDPNKIGIYGESMGGAMGIKYASENPAIKAIIAHAALLSVDDAVEVSMKRETGLPPFPFAPIIVYWAEKAGDFRGRRSEYSGLDQRGCAAFPSYYSRAAATTISRSIAVSGSMTRPASPRSCGMRKSQCTTVTMCPRWCLRPSTRPALWAGLTATCWRNSSRSAIE